MKNSVADIFFQEDEVKFVQFQEQETTDSVFTWRDNKKLINICLCVHMWVKYEHVSNSTTPQIRDQLLTLLF